MEFKQAIVTKQGQELMAKLLKGNVTTRFTKIAFSSEVYQDGQLEMLTALKNVHLTSSVTVSEYNSKTVQIVGVVKNDELVQSFYLNTVGLYANDPDKGEILYSVSKANVSGYIPSAVEGTSSTSLQLKLYTAVSNAEKVELVVDPSESATFADLERFKAEYLNAEEVNSVITNAITEFQQIHKVYNFKNKTVGNVATNPHILNRHGTRTTLGTPDLTNWLEATQVMYDNSVSVNGQFTSQAASAIDGAIPQFLARWNVVEQTNVDNPNMFNKLGLSTTAEKSRWLRNNSNRFAQDCWIRGGGVSGSVPKVSITYWNGTEWDTNLISNETSTVTRLTLALPAQALQDDGFIYTIMYADPSDGITKPQVVIDAIQFNHSYKLDLSKFYVPQTQIADGNTAGITKVVDNLNSLARTHALSAYAGKLLSDKLNGIPIKILQTNIESSMNPSEFIEGITIAQGHKANGFPQDYNTIITYKLNINRVTQWLLPKDPTGSNAKIQLRGVSVQDTWGEWGEIPLASALVNITDNQTIGGIKNFTAMPKLNGVDIIDDTGWVDVTYDDDWESYGTSPDNRLKIRRVGKEVMLTGTIKAKKTISASGNLTTRVWVSKVLPDQFKIPPGVYCGNLQQSSGNNMVYQSVDNATNKVYFERNRNGAGSPLDYNEGYWYPVNLRWLVN